MAHQGKESFGFYTQDGYLYCDDLKITDLHQQLLTSGLFPSSPAFVYSQRQLQNNVQQYTEALKELPVPAFLNFSIKANYNIHILAAIRTLGCGATLVSGSELQLALKAGFEPQRLLLNGSGKSNWEVEAALLAGVLLNVDSEFDLQQTLNLCQKHDVKARVLLRLNLDIDPSVHQYVSTGKAGSKFGLDSAALDRVTDILTSPDCAVRVEGLHCHLGSTIYNTQVFRKSVQKLLRIRQDLISRGLRELHALNIGGGLGIDYARLRDESKPFRTENEDVQREITRLNDSLFQMSCKEEDAEKRDLLQHAHLVTKHYIQERICRSDFDRHLCDLLEHLNLWTQVQQSYVQLWKKQEMPTPADLVHAIKDLFERPGDDDVTVIMEPGRSIVGNISALLTTVLGCKSSGQTRFVVVDGAMTEVIRPSLYGAYHHIQLAGPPSSVSETKTNVTRIGSGLSARDAEVCSADHTNEEICDTGRIKIDVVDVVGPVCESGDFLGKDRLLPRPQPGACVVVRDVGAYCSSMASNYNLRMRPAEVLVEGATWRLIRKPDTLEDLLKFYQIDSVDS